MAKDWAKPFYNSKAWQDCRASYISTVHGLCEHCLEGGKYVNGYIVDHIVELTIDNINDPMITLSYENLQFLCLSCHNTKHFGKDVDVVRGGLVFDMDGNLIEDSSKDEQGW